MSSPSYIWIRILFVVTLFLHAGLYAEEKTDNPVSQSTETSFVKCKQPDFEVTPASIRRLLEYNPNQPLKIISEHTCRIKADNQLEYPSQIYVEEGEFGFRVDIDALFNELLFTLLNKEAHADTRAIHILYMIDAQPRKLMSFSGYEGSGYRARVWHFYGDLGMYCPPYMDYMVVREWDSAVKKPHIVHKFRIQNLPSSCGMGG